MQCKDIMKTTVECLAQDDTVQQAATRMRVEGIGFLPICDEALKALGTITDRDLAIRVLAEGLPGTTPVRTVMTEEAITCRPEDDLERAEQLMAEHHKSRIMCVDPKGTLVGVISLSDIAQHETGAKASSTLRRVSAREARA